MNEIINILKKKKSLPLDQFIETALYNKKFGYYMKKNPFGKKGDFITSPLITKLFSEMIVIWLISYWQYLGKPKKINIIELGPGDGSLCKDILDTSKNFRDFYNSLEIKLLEKSDKLKKIQKIKIKNNKVQWINSISEIKYGPLVFLANEFFDSLSIKQIYNRKNKFFEKYVSLSKNKELKFIFKKANAKLVKNIKELNLISKGKIIEYPLNSIHYLKIIAKKIIKYNGGLLILDYGYNYRKNQNSLQSISKHKYQNIFSSPGNADITTLINYKLFAEVLKKSHLNVEKIVTQNEFLQKLGIVERANILSKKMSFKAKADMFYRLKKILDYNEMGNLFKVMFAKKKGKKFNLGF